MALFRKSMTMPYENNKEVVIEDLDIMLWFHTKLCGNRCMEKSNEHPDHQSCIHVEFRLKTTST